MSPRSLTLITAVLLVSLGLASAASARFTSSVGDSKQQFPAASTSTTPGKRQFPGSPGVNQGKPQYPGAPGITLGRRPYPAATGKICFWRSSATEPEGQLGAAYDPTRPADAAPFGRSGTCSAPPSAAAGDSCTCTRTVEHNVQSWLGYVIEVPLGSDSPVR